MQNLWILQRKEKREEGKENEEIRQSEFQPSLFTIHFSLFTANNQRLFAPHPDKSFLSAPGLFSF